MAGSGRKRQLFVKDGHSVRFFLHKSIKRQDQRQILRANIEGYGGRVASTDDRVDTVLISEAYDLELVRLMYAGDPDKGKRAVHVERLSFVQHCIQQKEFVHRAPVIKGMGGRIGHKNAVPFTTHDDDKLCEYLARVIPRKESGGRSGNRVYIRMVELGDECPERYSWVKRHTFHAWRERYKKNQPRFDPEIVRIAKREGTYDKPVWQEDRRMSRRRLRTGRHLEVDSSSEDEEEEEEENELENEGEEEVDQLREEEEEEEEEEELDQLREEQEEEEEEEEELDQLREEQEEEEEGELFQQPEDGDWDDYGQELEIPQDGDLDGQQVQDMDLGPSEIKKRKRVEPDQVAKKPRSNISHSYPAKPKGKEIAHESDQESDSDIEMDHTSLFSIVMDDEEVLFEHDEPGPSNVLRSPDHSLADPPSRSNHRRMSLTQETLVNTQSQILFEPMSHSTSANKRHSGHTSQSQPISRSMAGQEQESPPRLRPASPPRPIQRMTPETSRDGQGAPTNPKETKPASRGPRPQRAPPAIVQPSDAPYRNTRARSRSVEPIAMPPPTFKSTRRRTQKHEAAEKEVLNETSIRPTPITETIEEMDVEDILVTQDANLSTPGPVRARDPSLETDDAQTRQNLRPTSTVPGRRSAGTTFRTNKMKADDALRKFESSISRRYSAPLLQRPTQNDPAVDENKRPRQSEPQVSFNPFKLAEPRTPVNVPRPRMESESSVDTFPLKGTRASAAKRAKRKLEKLTAPFTPLKGTRAAEFAMSR